MSSIYALPLLALLFTASTDATPVLSDRSSTTSSSLASTTATSSSGNLSVGARAGLGIGIAVAAILLVLVTVFFALHIRRRRKNAALDHERAILAGEKNPDGSTKFDKYAPPGSTQRPPVRRNKSIKDQLMGPLYRGSTIEMPERAKQKLKQVNDGSEADLNGHHWTDADQHPFLHKPFANDSSPRPSFSSKRATRMMMMM